VPPHHPCLLFLFPPATRCQPLPPHTLPRTHTCLAPSSPRSVFDYATVVSTPAPLRRHCPVMELVTRSKLSCLSWNKYIQPQVASSDYEGAGTYVLLFIYYLLFIICSFFIFYFYCLFPIFLGGDTLSYIEFL
jgi:hypothetical protein